MGSGLLIHYPPSVFLLAYNQTFAASVSSNPLTFFWLLVTTFFETGLGLAAVFVYWRALKLTATISLKPFVLITRLEIAKGVIPFLKERARLTLEPKGLHINNRFYRFILGDNITQVPNRWWIRLLFLRGLAFVIIFTVGLNVLLSVGWANPFQTVSRNGITTSGWFYDVLFSRANNLPNGSHLVSYVGIPILGLYAMWKSKDEFMGPLVGAFLVAAHEGPWELLYYLGYSQYLTLDELTNVLKDVSFTSMIILFAVAFWKYPYRKTSMQAFKWPLILYGSATVAWFVLPWFFGYGFFPITTINNWQYGQGVYSMTRFWADPSVNGIEVFSWFGLFLMMMIAVWRGKPRS